MIEVIKAGLYDTIQDFGRMSCQEFGVPISGVMDRYSATLANSILGNSCDAAVLESVLIGPHLKFSRDTLICITGADMSVILNEMTLKTNSVYQVTKDDLLKFGKCNYGCRSYLAVLGGFQTEKKMGSQSMYNGVTSTFRIIKGDDLPILKANNHTGNTLSSIKIDKNHFEAQELEVYEGPEFDKLDDHQQQKLFRSTFSISKDSNRMAYQLEETLENSLVDIITSLVLPGTVQLTPSGKLIILMRDCQTTGGYPRVLQLTEGSVNKLSQKTFGAKFRFKRIKQ